MAVMSSPVNGLADPPPQIRGMVFSVSESPVSLKQTYGDGTGLATFSPLIPTLLSLLQVWFFFVVHRKFL